MGMRAGGGVKQTTEGSGMIGGGMGAGFGSGMRAGGSGANMGGGMGGGLRGSAPTISPPKPVNIPSKPTPLPGDNNIVPYRPIVRPSTPAPTPAPAPAPTPAPAPAPAPIKPAPAPFNPNPPNTKPEIKPFRPYSPSKPSSTPTPTPTPTPAPTPAPTPTPSKPLNPTPSTPSKPTTPSPSVPGIKPQTPGKPGQMPTVTPGKTTTPGTKPKFKPLTPSPVEEPNAPSPELPNPMGPPEPIVKPSTTPTPTETPSPEPKIPALPSDAPYDPAKTPGGRPLPPSSPAKPGSPSQPQTPSPTPSPNNPSTPKPHTPGSVTPPIQKPKPAPKPIPLIPPPPSNPEGDGGVNLNRAILEWSKIFLQPSFLPLVPLFLALMKGQDLAADLATNIGAASASQIANLIGYVAGLNLTSAFALPKTMIGAVALPQSLTGAVALPQSLTGAVALPQSLTGAVALPQSLTAAAAFPQTLKGEVILSQTIQSRCQEIEFELQNIHNHLKEKCKEIEIEIENINNQLKEKMPDIVGNGSYMCEDTLHSYDYNGAGLVGIHNAMKVQLKMMTQMIKEICMIADEFDDTIAGNILIPKCDPNDTLPGIRQSFLTTSNETNDTTQGGIFNETIEGSVNQIIFGGKGIKGINNQVNALIATNKIMADEICKHGGNNEEPIVVIPDSRFDWKKSTEQLEIAFGEQYPTQMGSIWRIHIPYPIPKEQLSWDDFEPLFINCGTSTDSTYGRVFWGGNMGSIPTCGWFIDESEAMRFLTGILKFSLLSPEDPEKPVRITKNGKNKRLREEPFRIRAVRAAIVEHIGKEKLVKAIWRPPGRGTRGRPFNT